MRLEMENTVAKQIRTTTEDSLLKVVWDANTTPTENAPDANARMQVWTLILHLKYRFHFIIRLIISKAQAKIIVCIFRIHEFS